MWPAGWLIPVIVYVKEEGLTQTNPSPTLSPLIKNNKRKNQIEEINLDLAVGLFAGVFAFGCN